MELQIGTHIISTDKFWSSGFKKYDDCIRGSICGNIADPYYCCDYKSHIGKIGIKGVIVKTTFIINSTGFKYLIKWEDGTFCGKPSSSIEIDKQNNRNGKLEEIFK